MHMRCSSCGAPYESDLRQQWGRTKETQGYGPQPVCVALVPIPGHPAAQQVCGGALYVTEAQPETAVRKLTTL